MSVVAFLAIVVAVAVAKGSAGSFQIHTFNIGQADSTLFLFPSGYTILYDAGELSWNSRRNALAIADKIRAITGGTRLDVAVLSHHHTDHIGYVGYGGFWHLLEVENFSIGKVIDRDAGTWRDPTHPECDHLTDVQWHNAGTQSGTNQRWICYATDPRNERIFKTRELPQYGSTTQISPPDEEAEVLVVLGDGKGVTFADGVTSLQGDHTALRPPPSENDYSVAIRVRYGSIVFAVAGDANGVYGTSPGNTYNDAERVMAPIFGDVEIWRASHHGSGHSSHELLLSTLNPRVSLISCGSNSYGHPFQDALDRMAAHGDIFITADICSVDRDYSMVTELFGADIVLVSDDGITYTINDRYHYDTRDPKPRRRWREVFHGWKRACTASLAPVLAVLLAAAVATAAAVAWRGRTARLQKQVVQA